MTLEEILKKNYETYNTIFKKMLVVFSVTSLLYIIMKIEDILLINTFTIIIFGIILFITFGFTLYTAIYLYCKIYNKIRLIVLKKKGILDDINFEISNLPNKDIKYALKTRFINTENYSIIFYRLLKILKFEDMTRLFEVVADMEVKLLLS